MFVIIKFFDGQKIHYNTGRLNLFCTKLDVVTVINVMPYLVDINWWQYSKRIKYE